ncbi:VWA domain-containing protein [Candidatus Woesearchaeota archaeon]|nr:VWA domain-containing protein [Candidatus Woesearchaeota archaeon]
MMFPENLTQIPEEVEEIEQLQGNLNSQFEEDKLMKSVLENDKKTLDEGKIINEAFNNNLQSFSPDLAFQHLVQNYRLAEQIMGERLISLLSGYDASYVKKNINIPEFQRSLQGNIKSAIEKLKDDGLIDDLGVVTEKGVSLASLVLYMQELEELIPHGYFGEKLHKKKTHYGEKDDVRLFHQGDRYKDLAVKKSVHLALRRGHHHVQSSDLKTFERKSKGQVSIIYALDASGSMKGRKIEMCKKAGIGLAYKAIDKKDKVGLLVFGSEITEEAAPTLNFPLLLKKITTIRATRETNFALMIEKAILLFSHQQGTKHLVILTDAQPTVGEDPRKKSLEAVAQARVHGITISLIGISLDKDAAHFAKDLTAIGEGKLYLVRDLAEIGGIVLEDYYSVV